MAVDVNQIAHGIMQLTTEKKEKNPAAVALGRLGGLRGGHARAAKLTPEQRKKIAEKAAKKRWENKNNNNTSLDK